MQADLAAEIAEYAKNVCRANHLRPYKREDLIREIIQDAEATKQWPKATAAKWRAAIEEACGRGLLARDSETVWVKFEPVASKPVQKGCSMIERVKMSEFCFVTEASKCPTCNADAIDRSEFWEAAPDNGKELEAIVAKVRKAVQNYYLALDRRQHGGVAQSIALNRIEQALGMKWVQGETTAFVDAHPMLKKLYD